MRKGKAHSAARPGDFAFCGDAYPGWVNALMWWLLPLGATALAIAWVMLRGRPTRPSQPHEGIESLRRMQHALQKPLPHGDAQRQPRGDQRAS